MIVLFLNPMTGRAEECRAVARAETKEALLRFVESEEVEPYTDGHYHKVFRQGGRLEWFNPPMGDDIFFHELVDVGTQQDWINDAIERWNKMLMEIPEVSE